VSVRDNGIGIPPHMLVNIFEAHPGEARARHRSRDSDGLLGDRQEQQQRRGWGLEAGTRALGPAPSGTPCTQPPASESDILAPRALSPDEPFLT
jgi:hypothetical protein